jgi:outer membrane receptor protein involved in Fe transport
VHAAGHWEFKMSIRIPAPRAPSVGACALAVAMALACPHPAAADDDDGDRSGLDTVVISALRSGATAGDTPVHATVVTREELAAAPATTLDQVLRDVQGMNFTGVPAAQSDPTGHQTKMRGLGNAKVLVLLDGVPVHDPFYLTTQWYKVPLDAIERVEVVRGGNSALWGNMAVGGVINVITRSAGTDSAEVGFGMGYFGTRTGSFTGTLATAGRWGFTLAADQSLLAGYQATPREWLWRFPGKGVTTARDSNAQLTARYGGDRLDAFVRAGYHVQDQLINYSTGSNVQKSPDFSAGLAWHRTGGEELQARAWAQYVGFEKYNAATCYFQPSGTRCPASNSVTAAQVNASVLEYDSQYGSLAYREQGASLAWSRAFTGWLRELGAGVDWRALSAGDHETFYAAPTVFTAPQGNLGSRTDGAARQAFTGAYVQLRLAPLPRTELTLAAREDGYRSTGRHSTRTTASGILTGGDQPDASKSAFDPSVGLRVDAGHGLALRGAWYRSFRAPGFNNTLRTFGASSPTIANPDLGPESLVGSEGGFDWALGPVELSGTYFRYDVRNQIATFRVNSYATAPALVRTICSDGGAHLALCGGSASFYTNDQDGQSHGIEASLRWHAGAAVDVAADYTHTSATLTRRGAVVTDPLNTQLAGLPADVLAARLTLRPHRAWRTQVEWRHIGRTPIDTTSVAGAVYSQQPIDVFNLGAGWQVNARLELDASLVNVGDLAYSEGSYTYTQPWNRVLSSPRTGWLGMHYRF